MLIALGILVECALKLRLSLRLHSTAALGYRAGRLTAVVAPPVAGYEPLPILPEPSQAGAIEVADAERLAVASAQRAQAKYRPENRENLARSTGFGG